MSLNNSTNALRNSSDNYKNRRRSVSTLPVILIIGACGHVGKETIIALSKDSESTRYRIRAGVREDNSAMMDDFGVETVHCDFNDSASVESAMMGVYKVFLILGNTENRLEQCKIARDAARKANVQQFVYLSAIGCDSSTFEMANQFRACEMIVQESGLVYTIIRSMLFQEILIPLAKVIAETGTLQLCISSAAIAPVSLADVGEAACNVLLGDVQRYAGHILQLTGDELLSGVEIAQILSRVIGKEITYLSISKQAMEWIFLQLGYSPWEAHGIADIMQSFSMCQCNFISTDNWRVLSRNCTKLETTLHSHKDHFTGKSKSSGNSSVLSSKEEALYNMAESYKSPA